MSRDPSGLCEKCFYRQDSRRRVQEYIQIRLDRGETPPFEGRVLDPQPRYECKEHEGYGREVNNKIECRDFHPQDNPLE